MPDTIVDKLVDAAGNPIDNAHVKAHLRVSSGNDMAFGFDTSGLQEVLPTAEAMTQSDGTFSLDLIPNDSFDDDTPGSYYEITATAGSRTYGPAYVVVPSAGGPYKLQDILTATPATLDVVSVQTMVPRLFVSDAGTGLLTEVTYGTAPAARGCKYRAGTDWCRARYMIRMDTGGGASMGTSGRYFALELPVPAELTLGNGIAEIVGHGTLGLTVSPVHKPIEVHTGVVGDLTNPNYCYFVADDTIAVANNSFSATPTQWTDFHIAIEYDR